MFLDEKCLENNILYRELKMFYRIFFSIIILKIIKYFKINYNN